MVELMQVSEISVSYKPVKGDRPLIKSCAVGYNVIRNFFPLDTIAINEQMVVLYLNRAHRVIAAYKVSSGGITGTIGDLRLIFSVGLKSLATIFIVAHNHPSGNLDPSQTDIAFTLRLKEAGRLIDIKLMDHLILSPEEGQYYSFAENGII